MITDPALITTEWGLAWPVGAESIRDYARSECLPSNQPPVVARRKSEPACTLSGSRSHRPYITPLLVEPVYLPSLFSVSCRTPSVLGICTTRATNYLIRGIDTVVSRPRPPPRASPLPLLPPLHEPPSQHRCPRHHQHRMAPSHLGNRSPSQQSSLINVRTLPPAWTSFGAWILTVVYPRSLGVRRQAFENDLSQSRHSYHCHHDHCHVDLSVRAFTPVQLDWPYLILDIVPRVAQTSLLGLLMATAHLFQQARRRFHQPRWFRCREWHPGRRCRCHPEHDACEARMAHRGSLKVPYRQGSSRRHAG